MIVALSLAAAFAYALATVLQQRAAAAAPRHPSMHPGLLRYLVMRPLWLLGIVADLLGFTLQAWALRRGSLLIVQLLLVSGLLFALPLGAALARRLLRWREWLGAVLVAIGLIIFLIWASPHGGRPQAPVRAWLVVGGVMLLIVGSTVLAARLLRRTLRAVLLSAGAGIVLGLTAALTHSAVVLLHTGLFDMLDAWQLYALIAAGGLGLVLAQSAFHEGSLSTSLPTLTVIDPIASGVLGLTLFHQQLPANAAPIAAGAAALIIGGVFALSSSPLIDHVPVAPIPVTPPASTPASNGACPTTGPAAATGPAATAEKPSG